jgi:hypothetical protein
MITASKARELVELSSVNMDRRLKWIGEKIEQAATLGQNMIWLDLALPYNTELSKVEESDLRPAEFTHIQRLVRDKLVTFGFNMVIASREVHIGGGLGSMDDAHEVKIKKLPYIKVTW